MNAHAPLFEHAKNGLLDHIAHLRQMPRDELRKSPYASRECPRLQERIVEYIDALIRFRPEARLYLQEAAVSDGRIQAMWSVWATQPPHVYSIGAHCAYSTFWRNNAAQLGDRLEDLVDAVSRLETWRLTHPTPEDSTKPATGKPRSATTTKKPGRPRDPQEAEERKMVSDRWEHFKQSYRQLGYPRRSYAHFATWANQTYDDMPSNDPEELKRMVDTHRKSPLQSSDCSEE